MEKLTINVGELARQLGIGRNQAYSLCKTPGFPAIQIGKRIIVPVEPLQEWLREKGMEQKTIDGV